MMRGLPIIISAILILFQPDCFSQKERLTPDFKTESSIIYGICFTTNGEVLGIADNTKLKFFNTDSKVQIQEFKSGHKNQILAMDISNDSSIVASGGKDSLIIIWDFAEGTILENLKYHKGKVTSVKISPDGKYLLSGGSDNTVILYSMEQSRIIMQFSDHSDDITSVQFSPDGKQFASASGDHSIKIYDTMSGELKGSLKGHTDWVRDISFSSDGKQLVSCGDDSRIITWLLSDPDRFVQLDARKEGSGWLTSIDVSEDGKAYVAGGIDGQVIIGTQFNVYKSKMNRSVNNLRVKPNEGTYLKIALATRGKGVVLLDALHMKLHPK